MRSSRITGLVAVLILTASCGGDSPRGTAAGTNAESPTQAASPTEDATLAPGPGGDDPGKEVSFQAEDGTKLRGRIWGGGEIGVVLAHGFSELTGQDDWLPFPGILAHEGYQVLTFNFRGFCSDDGCSGRRMELGNNWMDAVAAKELLEERGAQRVFLIGGSMGGIAVFRAAEASPENLVGIVSISTPQFPSQYYPSEHPEDDVTEARLQAIDAPKLFFAGDGDAQLVEGGRVIRFADEAQSMVDAAAGEKEILILDTSAHSHELVTTAEPDVVEETRQRIFEFLEENA